MGVGSFVGIKKIGDVGYELDSENHTASVT